MASSLFVNNLQVNFTSVLAMEHVGMVRMFKALEDTRLRGFLEGTTSMFESVVVEFLSNARVIAGTVVSTVCGQKLVITTFSGTFKLSTEGMTNFANISNETITEMRTMFSATEVPFKSSGKKKELLFEYRLLHDIVAKSLCAKAGSFDSVTSSRKQSQGFIVQISMLMELLVKADLGASTKLHTKKVLTSKQVENYIKANQGISPTGETSKQMEDTASNTEGGASQNSQQVRPEVTKSVATVTEPTVPNPKKRKHKGRVTKTQTNLVATQDPTSALDTAATQTIENRGTVDSTISVPEEDSEPDPCPLVQRRCRKTKESESSDSGPLTQLLKIMRTQRQHQQSGWTGVTIATQPDQIPATTTEPNEVTADQILQEYGADHFDGQIEVNAPTEQEGHNDQDVTTDNRDGSHHNSIPIISNEAANRHHSVLVGFKLITPESDFLPNQVNEATAITSHEHAHKSESLIQTVRHAHQDHDEQGFIERVDQVLGATPISVINPEVIPSTEQLLNTATQSLNVISTHVSSLDQSYARLRDDKTITRHHTTKLRDELKSTAEGFDIRIDVLE
ncbi:hypothetical protein F511_17427 [Dorcoceras hygrometricum]|uniref:Uncharacterized protein n=1 Tax=Dorcoceras hygrometricum TaxID=472368 RepID=A0A2Z7D695_9LAMI|nr:hypothetical protein F511_17427 [Dorcoceras hygrometricum]